MRRPAKLAKPRAPKRRLIPFAEARTLLNESVQRNDETVTCNDIVALWHAASSVAVQSYADVRLIEMALARGDASSFQTVHAETHARVTSCLRIVDGLAGKEAIRNRLFLLIEEVAMLASPDCPGALNRVEALRRATVAESGEIAYVRLLLRTLDPDLERRAPDSAIERALEVCRSAGPGKRDIAEPKASALAKVWKDISGESIEPSTFEPSLSKARSASRKSTP